MTVNQVLDKLRDSIMRYGLNSLNGGFCTIQLEDNSEDVRYYAVQVEYGVQDGVRDDVREQTYWMHKQTLDLYCWVYVSGYIQLNLSKPLDQDFVITEDKNDS